MKTDDYRPIVVKWEGYSKRFEMKRPINKTTIRRAMSRLLGVKFVAEFTWQIAK